MRRLGRRLETPEETRRSISTSVRCSLIELVLDGGIGDSVFVRRVIDTVLGFAPFMEPGSARDYNDDSRANHYPANKASDSVRAIPVSTAPERNNAGIKSERR